MWRRGKPRASGEDAKHVTLIRARAKGKSPSTPGGGGKTSFSTLYKSNLCASPSSARPVGLAGIAILTNTDSEM
jgi:hypothetical protein